MKKPRKKDKNLGDNMDKLKETTKKKKKKNSSIASDNDTNLPHNDLDMTVRGTILKSDNIKDYSNLEIKYKSSESEGYMETKKNKISKTDKVVNTCTITNKSCNNQDIQQINSEDSKMDSHSIEIPITTAKKKKKKFSAKDYDNRWDLETIGNRISELENELIESKKNGTLTKSRRKRILNRLRTLRLASCGKLSVGGQLKKREKSLRNKKRNRLKSVESNHDNNKTNQYHEQGMKSKKNRHLICLRCKKRGHLLTNCRLNDEHDVYFSSASQQDHSIESNQNNYESNEMRSRISGICFKCGDATHTLKNCPKSISKDEDLPFATCFLCNKSGHIASKCSENTHGIYPKGGNCRFCGSIYHLIADCPIKKKKLNESQKSHKVLGSKKKSVSDDESFNNNDPDEFWIKLTKNES